jgi:hypothetical protein
VLLARRWDLLKSRWVWAGAAIALAIWAPNLIWQAMNGWPQLEMARVITARSTDDNRGGLVLLQVLFAGPLLFPIFLAGLWWLLRSPDARPWRPIGWSYLVVLALIYLTAGKGYYSGGLIPTLTAAGAVVTAGWLERGRREIRWLKTGVYSAATVASAIVVVSIALPIVPTSEFPNSAQATINSDSVNTYGWNSFVSQVRGVSDSLSPTDRERTAILTANYGEAGSLELLSAPGLPPVYSGENSYAYWGPPDDGKTLTILVMNWDGAGSYWGQWLGPCRLATTIDLGLPDGMGEEQGAGVWVCGDRSASWSEIWGRFRNIG